jgi:hypothetical protein
MAPKACVFALALVAVSAMAEEPAVAPLRSTEMQPGYGVVESVTEARIVERSAATGGSAAAGGSSTQAASRAERPVFRVAVRMPDGTLQYRDLDRPEFAPGDHVLLTNAGDVLPD